MMPLSNPDDAPRRDRQRWPAWRLAAAALLLGIAGCASKPPAFDFVPPLAGVSPHQTAAVLRNVSAALAPPGETQGHVQADVVFAVPAWSTAVRDAFVQSGLLNGDQTKPIDVLIKVMALEAPPPSITARATAQARYQIIALPGGAMLFDQVVTTTGNAHFDGTKDPTTLRVDAINNAVQNNIATFMNMLYVAPPGITDPKAGEKTQ